MAAVPRFALQTRSSMFMVVLAAFSVFSYEITGRADPAIRAFTTGRDEPAFQNTMGLFLNVVPFQTDISRCASFREIVASTRDTCIDAYAHEVPITVIEQDLPDFNALHDDPKMSQFILGMYQSMPGDEADLPIADGAYPILERTQPSTETSDIPSGMVWNMSISSAGGLTGNVVYNLDEFDEPRVTGWVSGYNRILSRLVSEPDREWRQLTGLTS
jgi:non-ribosomal peptide synthetase component F